MKTRILLVFSILTAGILVLSCNDDFVDTAVQAILKAAKHDDGKTGLPGERAGDLPPPAGDQDPPNGDRRGVGGAHRSHGK